MSEQITPDIDPEIVEAKKKYGDLVVITLEGQKLAFRRLDKAKITDMKRAINKNTDLSLDVSINCCGFVCVVGQASFVDLANKYPLAFCGTEGIRGVIDVLMDLARGGEAGPDIRVV